MLSLFQNGLLWSAWSCTLWRCQAAQFRCEHYSVSRTAPLLAEPVPLFGPETYAVDRFPEATCSGCAYDQFLHSLANAAVGPPPAVLELNYSISPSTEHTWSFEISGGWTSGGSSFAIQTESDNAVGSCAVVDKYDGTYRVTCAPTKTLSARLTVVLTHVRFGAFSPFGSRNVVQQNVAAPLFDCQYDAPALVESNCHAAGEQNALLLDSHGGWWTDVRTPQPKHHTTAWCTQHAPVSLESCVNTTFTNIYMFGESHMRFFYDLLLQELGIFDGNLEVKHSDDSTRNIHYFATHYITQGPEGGVMIDALRKTNFTTNSLVLISFGSWHLHGMGLAKTILDLREVLVPEVQRILDIYGARVVVFTGPAKFKQVGAFAGIENTASMTAILEAVSMLMPKDVIVLDMVNPTRGFLESALPAIDWDCQNDNQCQCHMLCRLGGGSNVTGRFGTELFHLAMNEACAKTDP